MQVPVDKSVDVMIDKLSGLWPEISLLVGACLCLAVGLAKTAIVRQLTVLITAASLFVAGVLVMTRGHSGAADYIKLAVVVVGLLLLLVAAGVPDQLRSSKEADAPAHTGHLFDPGLVMRGEFFAFFLFSLTGVMLVAGATDLVWLFLALELTSLPTYVLVATARDRVEAQESAVKYFFLGAMAAAVFLYGFALIYGATGTTDFAAIQHQAAVGPISPLFITGVVLAVVGIAFKIAAVPMHFYAADVYQGATTPVTAFLAFVPKTAGFVALLLILGLAGHPLPQAVTWLLWIMAALTMTWGNVLGLLQTNVKRILAYSSIAHSGYMLVGLVALGGTERVTLGSGQAAIFFYLIAYGLATIGAFAVLGCLQTRGQESQELADISGLSRRHPGLAAIMLISVLSLVGLPPMIGFIGKIYLFGSAIEQGFIWLVVIAVINSAISAVYYLRIASACYFGQPDDQTVVISSPTRFLGGALAATAAIVLGISGGTLVDLARRSNISMVAAPAASDAKQAMTTNAKMPAAVAPMPADGM